MRAKSGKPEKQGLSANFATEPLNEQEPESQVSPKQIPPSAKSPFLGTHTDSTLKLLRD